jgi:hypothetical protein
MRRVAVAFAAFAALQLRGCDRGHSAECTGCVKKAISECNTPGGNTALSEADPDSAEETIASEYVCFKAACEVQCTASDEALLQCSYCTTKVILHDCEGASNIVVCAYELCGDDDTCTEDTVERIIKEFEDIQEGPEIPDKKDGQDENGEKGEKGENGAEDKKDEEDEKDSSFVTMDGKGASTKVTRSTQHKAADGLKRLPQFADASKFIYQKVTNLLSA